MQLHNADALWAYLSFLASGREEGGLTRARHCACSPWAAFVHLANTGLDCINALYNPLVWPCETHALALALRSSNTFGSSDLKHWP